MGYAELGRALEDEARRQIAELVAESERSATGLLDEARREAGLERERALAAEARAAADEARRTEARLGLEGEGALLVEARVILADLAAEAARRLAGLGEDVAVRLVAELLPELEGPGWRLTVDAGAVDAVRARVGERIEVAAGAVAGAIGERGGRTLDNTLPTRLSRVMSDVEPELARRLFGDET